MKKTTYQEIKHPRLIVSNSRHKLMWQQAKREGITMEELTERQLKFARKHKA